MGALHPALRQALDLPAPVLAFEIDCDALPAPVPPAFRAPSRYPSMRRDVALEVDSSLAATALLEAVRRAAGPLLSNLELFDVYQGEGIDLGKKSLALGLIFQKSSSTLMEEEVDAELRKILNFLREKFGASLRS
jgi:phenylalanyl-tRNA synthetase beta chain